MKTMVITGHKKHEIGLWGEKHPAFPILKKAYQQKIIAAVEEGAEWFLNGGERGLELYAAKRLLELQEEYPQIQLAMLLPFYEQEKLWQESEQEMYHEVLACADFVDYISKREYVKPWQLIQKNVYLVQKSDGLITFFNGAERTHPWYYLQEAQKKQESGEYSLWVMEPDGLQNLVEEMNQSW